MMKKEKITFMINIVENGFIVEDKQNGVAIKTYVAKNTKDCGLLLLEMFSKALDEMGHDRTRE